MHLTFTVPVAKDLIETEAILYFRPAHLYSSSDVWDLFYHLLVSGSNGAGSQQIRKSCEVIRTEREKHLIHFQFYCTFRRYHHPRDNTTDSTRHLLLTAGFEGQVRYYNWCSSSCGGLGCIQVSVCENKANCAWKQLSPAELQPFAQASAFYLNPVSYLQWKFPHVWTLLYTCVINEWDTSKGVGEEEIWSLF